MKSLQFFFLSLGLSSGGVAFAGSTEAGLGGALGGRKNPSLIRDLATGEVVRPS